MPIHGAVRTDLGRVRTQNEDSFGFFPDRSFYVVADGMGGYAGGEIASALAVETMLHSLIQTQQEDFTPLLDKDGHIYVGGRRLMIAVQQANAAVFQKSAQDPSLAGMGTTIAAVLFENQDRSASICHVGDSRVYHIRHEAIEQLTEDHSFVQQLFREGKLSAEEMKVSPHRHMLTQAVGINPMVQPALGTTRLEVGDLIVLCSDGLHGLVKGEEILQITTSHASDLQQACDVLVSLANDRGGTDNCTVIVLRCDDVEDGDQTREKPLLP